MPAAMRCTSPGLLSIGGSDSITAKVIAVEKPMMAAKTTIHAPLDEMMPSDRQERDRPEHEIRQVRQFCSRAGDRDQEKRGEELRAVERDEGGADQVGAAVADEIVGQEGVGAEIHAVVRAEGQAEQPAPVGSSSPATTPLGRDV